MPLQNRVTPSGELIADPARGLLMGNRGGRFHSEHRTLGPRRWTSRQWICCRLQFKHRHREVWGKSYTELFFLDEPTALAAGHRPCFECRRNDAERFARLFSGGNVRASAGDIDSALHSERIDGRRKRVHRASVDKLPDGVFIELAGSPYALRAGQLWHWTPFGYDGAHRLTGLAEADLLTPPSTVRVLMAGYEPVWHPTAAG